MMATQRTGPWERKPTSQNYLSHRTRTLEPKRASPRYLMTPTPMSGKPFFLVPSHPCPGKLVRGPGDGNFGIRQNRFRGRRLTQTILPGSGVRQGGPGLLKIGGRRVPSPPKNPLYPLSVPMGRPAHLVAERWTTPGNNRAATCAQIAHANGPTDSKPAKPDPRLRTPSTCVCRPNNPVLRAFSVNP